MGDSTKLLTQISASQANKETTMNEITDALSPASLYGRRALGTTGLTWGYFGGRWNSAAIANGTVALTANTTNYVVANRTTGAVSVSTATTNWNNATDYLRCYSIVTGASTVTSYQDHRQAIGGSGGGGGGGGGQVNTIVAGVGVSVDSTDPVNPIVSAPGNGREILTANIDYYVRTDGNDSNDGSANTSGAAFLTIQHALDLVSRYDLNGFTILVHVANGTYAGDLSLAGMTGGGSVEITGNTTTPGSVILTATSASLAVSDTDTDVLIQGFRLNTSGDALVASNATLFFGQITFGTASGSHISATNNAAIIATDDYSIVGAASQHFYSDLGSSINIDSVTVTITGTPAFSSAFAVVNSRGFVRVPGVTFTGSATGKRFTLTDGGRIFTGNAGLSFLPGSTAGTVASGAVYDVMQTAELRDFMQNPATTTGLTYGYHGGTIRADNATTLVVAGTVALTLSTTNYVEITGAGAVSANTTGFTAGRFPMAQIVTGVSTITSVTDKRGFASVATGGGGGTPGGSTTQVQYNNAGAFAGNSGFTYDSATNTLTIGRVATTASTTTRAGLNVPHGAAPTSPVNGDVWTTSGGLYAQINGATVGPYATSAGSLTNPMTTIGDIIQGTTGGAPARLAAVATGNALISGGVGTANSWGKIGLTTHVSGILPAANGGTGQSSYAVGDIVYASTTTALSKLSAGTSGYVLTSNGAGVAPSWQAGGGGGSGVIVDRAYAEYATYSSHTSTIPSDNSLPQITEGTQILSAAITPKSATNRLRVRVQLFCTGSTAAVGMSAALFNGATNAIAATHVTTPTANFSVPLVMEYEYVPGVTTALTHTVRVGPNSATMYVNGNSTTQFFGGASHATITIDEITP